MRIFAPEMYKKEEKNNQQTADKKPVRRPSGKNKKGGFNPMWIYILVAIALGYLYTQSDNMLGAMASKQVSYSRFKYYVEQGYARGITANKDEGKLSMQVVPGKMTEVFGTLPKDLKEQPELVTEYPSGMRVNSLLAAKNFGVHRENILVGNGAAELIKSLMGFLNGRIGIVRPTFEEYPNRCEEDRAVIFKPANRDYAYTAEDLIAYFGQTDIQNLILINPDNPSGTYIPKAGLLKLIAWSAEKGIRLVVDESFADFADEPDNTLIDQDILSANPHLFVMKSISKSYGVPGLRLGVLASGDEDTIAKMKKDVAIWNINSIAEFYMQIEGKYAKDYAAALVRIRAERARFQGELARVKGFRVIPSQANYVMVELDGDISPKALLKRLLIKHNLLIKELTAKTDGQSYLRLAVRNRADNDALIAALMEELGEKS